MGITLEDLALVAAFNFFVQLFVDFTVARYADRIGYRKLMVTGQLCAALGLIGYAVLPFLFAPLTGLLMASFLCAVGGGIVEVLVSPIIEACPSDQKSASMSILHRGCRATENALSKQDFLALDLPHDLLRCF